MSRVKIFHGANPFLIVAPHGGGPTDLRSAFIAGIIAKEIDGFAVINEGWKRRGTPNFRLSYANCNSISHCLQEPLLSEFLEPIDECRKIILLRHHKVHLFLIHGMDERKNADIVLGYGAGNPSRHSCSLCFKDRFLSCLSLENFQPAQGKSGGKLSGWDKDNLNQLYQPVTSVESIQVEIGLSLRKNNSVGKNTAKRISEAITRTHDKSRFVPSPKNIKEI